MTSKLAQMQSMSPFVQPHLGLEAHGTDPRSTPYPLCTLPYSLHVRLLRQATGELQ